MSRFRKILVAPTAYKGSLTPRQVALAIGQGIAESGCGAEVVLAPVADGGDGTVEALNLALGGELRELTVRGALGAPTSAEWLKLGDSAVVELASASGIAHLRDGRLSAVDAHTYGTGEVIRHCLDVGLTDIVVTVGGSASTDGGTAALSALGARFLDDRGNELDPGGGRLVELADCDLSMLDERLGRTRLRVATDVANPLCGPTGAAAVFAPQKGASPHEVETLEVGLCRLADVLARRTGRDLRDVPGSGAAGGAAFGLAAALGAEIMPGFRWLSELIDLEEKIVACDLVITGEGRLDSQSLSGKVVGELARLCSEHARPLWAVPAVADMSRDWSDCGIVEMSPAAEPGRHATAGDITRAVAALLSGPCRP